jgi:hypothetical protein
MGIQGTISKDPQLVIQKKILTRSHSILVTVLHVCTIVTERLIYRAMHRVFDETLQDFRGTRNW